MKKFNLIVIGGGFAGTAAAISAARKGLSVLLVEKSNCLGGAAVNCLVNPFMTNATKITENGVSAYFPLSRGLFTEITEELKKMSALSANVFQEEYLKIILNRMVLGAGAELLFHSYFIDAKLNGETIESITVANKSGKQELFADYFIDATGDADLAVLCGSPFRLGREKDQLCQPMTLCFRVANVDIEKFQKARPMINGLYQNMQKQGLIKNIREDVLYFSNLVNGVVHFNSTRVVKRNPVDAFDLTKAEIEAREQVLELFRFLKENIDGFQNSDLLLTAPEIGVRESRMIDGEYVLTGEDLIACTKFEDSIALGNYDIDIHNPEGSGTSHYFFPEGQYYSIPYRSLIPKKTNNLLVAGRCISVTHEAQASIRIMPIVCCIGEAAGIAISVAAKNTVPVSGINVKNVQDELKKQGAIY
jgi:Pyruvate/2-oxoglutarate dehydrogenase complex, dihydrolipoamide dehydrogenase (E3) component, and related enzymes